MKNCKKKTVDNKLIIEHAPLVKRIAHHLLGRLPNFVQADDLVQAGMIGLLEAIKNFDPDKGASFTTYAGIRIRGAILDEVRRGEWAPRSVYRNSRRISEAIKKIENKYSRDARDHEIAEELSLSLNEYYHMLQETNSSKIFQFDDIGMTEEVITGTGDNKYYSNPLDGIQHDDFKEKLSKNIATLPKKEQLVLALYYDEDLNLKEVGEVIGVSESRISQIHSQAMHRLQARIKKINFEE